MSDLRRTGVSTLVSIQQSAPLASHYYLALFVFVVVLVILLQKHSCAFPSFSTDALFSATAVSTPPASQTCSQSTGAGIISVFAQGFFLNELVFSVALIALIHQFLIEDINSDIACLCQYHIYVEQQDVKRPLLIPLPPLLPPLKHTHTILPVFLTFPSFRRASLARDYTPSPEPLRCNCICRDKKKNLKIVMVAGCKLQEENVKVMKMINDSKSFHKIS